MDHLAFLSVQDITLESVCDLESLCLWECFRHIASDFPLGNYWVHALHLGWYYGTAMKCMRLSLPMPVSESSKYIWKKRHNINTISYSFSSVAQWCPTPCDPMNHSTPCLPVFRICIHFFFLHLPFLRYDFCLLYGAFDAEFNWGRGLHTGPRQEPNWITCNGLPIKIIWIEHQLSVELWQLSQALGFCAQSLNPGSATPHPWELGQLWNLSEPLPSFPHQGLLITPSVRMRTNMFK